VGIIVGVVIIAAAAVALVYFLGRNDYGTRLEFNGGELYYTSEVTRAEADALGRFLIDTEFFDGEKKTVQLDKAEVVYLFRMVMKEEFRNDPEMIALAEDYALLMSAEVFNGAPLEIHFTDERLKTVRIAAQTVNLVTTTTTASGLGTRLEVFGAELYYTPNTTRAEADALGQFLIDTGFFDGTMKTVQLDKAGDVYQFRMVVLEEARGEPEMVTLAQEYARQMSTDVFRGSPVEVHFTDENMMTLEVVRP
jgi:RNase H-fold protein (predicted Holliday junction resolvase)